MSQIAEFSAEVTREAYIRGMEPEDYIREIGDCERADERLAEMDRIKLQTMRATQEEEKEEELEPAL